MIVISRDLFYYSHKTIKYIIALPQGVSVCHQLSTLWLSVGASKRGGEIEKKVCDKSCFWQLFLCSGQQSVAF